MLDRQRQNLRGPVSSCTEQITYSATTAADGATSPSVDWQSTTKYDPAGRVLSKSVRQSDGSQWITRNTYDTAGRLLKTVSGIEGQAMAETAYSYDCEGRLQSITDGNKQDNAVTFKYDEIGRKTKIDISRPADYRPNVASGGSPFESLDHAPNLPGGGTAITTYDENDRATEVQVRDANGDLVNRAVRTYDPQGNIAEELQIVDDPARMIPPDARANLLEESGLSADQLDQELRMQLRKLMAGQMGPYSVAYSYDAQGRPALMRRRVFNKEEEIETTYNEHGDVSSEITRDKPSAEVGDSTNPAPGPQYSEARYSYKYDQHENWVEKSVSYRFAPDSEFQPSTVTTRTLTYY